MIVFKTFLKILNKNKFIVILYTVLLIGFGGFNVQTSDSSMSFVASKPDIAIVNDDKEEGITKDLIRYISLNSNIIDLENKTSLDDALFYRDVNYIIYIPKDYNILFMEGKNPEIKVKSTGDYQASLAEMILKRYIKVANAYRGISVDSDDLINKINDTLSLETKTNVTSKLDTNALERATMYYNFASYSILAALVYVICLILSSFKNINIQKRTIISSSNYKEINRDLLLSNILLSIVVWLVYVVLSFVLIGKTMMSYQGLLYIINSLVFNICATSLAMFIGSLVNNKDAVNGIVNVVALGSSFLCGAFVPMQFLPDGVIKLAHILPSYYFISTNEMIKTTEVFNISSIKPMLVNCGVLILFSMMFVIITNIISRRKQKIG